MDSNARKLRVIEACPAQTLFVQIKAQRFDQVQPGAGVSAQTDDVTGVRRNFGFVKDQAEHGRRWAVGNGAGRMPKRRAPRHPSDRDWVSLDARSGNP